MVHKQQLKILKNNIQCEEIHHNTMVKYEKAWAFLSIKGMGSTFAI